jgi:uncharacterized protein (UPF0276 family)
MVDVDAAHEALAELLIDPKARHRWEVDPSGYAAARFGRGAEASMVAGLDSGGLAWAADVITAKQQGRDALQPRQRASQEAMASAPLPNARRPARPTRRPRHERVLVGVGYRPALFRNLFADLHLVEVWEQTIDSFLGGREYAARSMAVFATGSPLTVHSLDLSVGSSQAREQPERLAERRHLLALAGVDVISDHLAFSRVPGRCLPHFAPVWRVEECVDLVAANVTFLQEVLGARLALENVALPFDPGGDVGTAEFLNELCRRTGCGVHLDITNLTINAANGFCNASTELAVLELENVLSVHLAGGGDEDGVLRDMHAFPVPPGDVRWLERLLPDMVNCRSVVIERDVRQHRAEEVAEDLRRVHAAVDRSLAALPADTLPHAEDSASKTWGSRLEGIGEVGDGDSSLASCGRTSRSPPCATP